MSNPIKDTPILEGKDKINFLIQIEKNKSLTKEEMAKIIKDYIKIINIIEKAHNDAENSKIKFGEK
jgi:hypothetical protein